VENAPEAAYGSQEATVEVVPLPEREGFGRMNVAMFEIFELHKHPQVISLYPIQIIIPITIISARALRAS
jgi:hypothetical protein